jgi:uncharacterized membrane protein YGL010W
MKSFDQWMSDYAESHQHPTNKAIHKICVPLITFTVLGFLWLIPTPEAFNSVPYLNYSTIFAAGVMVWYLVLNIKMAIAMMVELAIMFAAVVYLFEMLGNQNFLYAMIGIFVVSWIFQFIGHKVEGKKPSFLQDLVFLLIGPLWVLRSFGVKA